MSIIGCLEQISNGRLQRLIRLPSLSISSRASKLLRRTGFKRIHGRPHKAASISDEFTELPEDNTIGAAWSRFNICRFISHLFTGIAPIDGFFFISKILLKCSFCSWNSYHRYYTLLAGVHKAANLRVLFIFLVDDWL